MSKRSRILLVVMVGIMAFSLSLSVYAKPKKEIVLKFLTHWVGTETNAKIAKTLVDEFNVQNKNKGIRVEIDGVPEYSNCLNKLKTNIAADVPVDIFFIQENITNEGFWAYGKLGNLTKYIDSEFKSWKTSDDWSEGTAEGKIVGIPCQGMLVGMYYNKDMFAKAGVTAPFKSWDDFYAGCAKIKAAGFIPVSMQTMGTAWTSMLMYSNYCGGKIGPKYIKDANVKKSFNNPAYVEGAKMLLKMKQEGWTTQDALGGDYQVAANNFLQSRTAMIANGPWMVTDIKSNGLYDKLGLMPFPGNTMISGPMASLCTSAKNESDPERMKAIVSFLKFFSNPVNTKRMIIEGGNPFVNRKIVWSDKDQIEPILRQLYAFASDKKITGVNQMRDALPSTFGTVMEEELANMWMGKITPEQYVKNLGERTFAK